jgi:hypothetical protein
VWSTPVKKGRHRRFEEARALKRGPDIDIEHIFEEESDDEGADLPGRSGWYEDEALAPTADSEAQED